MSEPFVEPVSVVQIVEHFVDREHDHAAKYENKSPLDESGVYDLHSLAARIYAEGYREGRMSELERNRYRHIRRSATAAQAPVAGTTDGEAGA